MDANDMNHDDETPDTEGDLAAGDDATYDVEPTPDADQLDADQLDTDQLDADRFSVGSDDEADAVADATTDTAQEWSEDITSDSADDMTAAAEDTTSQWADDIAADETSNEWSDAAYKTDTGTLPPAPVVAPVGETRLVRDPYATFGGVASGIAHRYGWDVALTRIVFLVMLFVSGGLAIPVYLLSWLVIPRANFWPPHNVRASGGGVSGRELGIGLLGAGILVALAAGGGSAGAVLVPLVLVGAGIWMLMQNPKAELAASGGADVAMAAAPAMASMPPAPQVAMTTPLAAPGAPPGAPVEPRSRGRRFFMIALLLMLGLLALAMIVIPVIAIVAFASDGDFDFEGGESVSYIVNDLNEVPFIVDRDAGEVIVDFRDFDIAELETLTVPAEIDIDLNVGAVTVFLPPDLPVNIDAEVTLGDVNVFGSSESGVGSDIKIDDPDALLDISIDIAAGEIDVIRSSGVAG